MDRKVAGTAQLDHVLNSAQGKTRDQLAALAGVGHDTIDSRRGPVAEASEGLVLHAGPAALIGLLACPLKQLRHLCIDLLDPLVGF